MVKNLTDKDFVKETSTGVTLTDFWATWCPPCRMQGPIIEQLDKEIGDKVKINGRRCKSRNTNGIWNYVYSNLNYQKRWPSS